MENHSDKLIDYLDNKLSVQEMKEMEQALANTPELSNDLEELKQMMNIMDSDTNVNPSPRLKTNFDSFLKEQIRLQEFESSERIQNSKKNTAAKTVKLSTVYRYAVAAAALILVGVLAGRLYTQEEQIDVMSQELYAMLEEKSTSQRIKAVNMSHDIEAPNDGILEALIKTMNTDKSSNVRLAAVTALEKFTEDKKVINAFINSLGVQDDPTVTIALINILASIKEQNAIAPLEQLLKDDKHMQFVKDEAQVGIFKLTSI